MLCQQEQEDVYFNYDPDDYTYTDMEVEEVEKASVVKNIYFSEDELMNHIISICKLEIQSIFSTVTLDEILALLVAYNFQVDKIKDDLGTSIQNTKKHNRICSYKKFDTIECSICLESYQGPIESCCSYICQFCLAQHLKQSITDWKLDLQCPACRSKVFSSLLGKDLHRQYKKRLLLKYMKAHKNYTQCLDCEKFIQFCGAKKIVKCECNCQICFECGAFAHQPLSCQKYREWNGKIVDESRNLIYIQKNAKKCSNCNWFIEKNSGCNHMTCSKCRYQFCWLCLGDWKKHSNCAAYTKNGQIVHTKSNIAKVNEQQTQRLQFYGSRFQNYDQGQKFAKKMKLQLPPKINMLGFLLQTRQNQFNFFYEALNTIIMTRRRIKSLYAFIYMYKLENKQKGVLQFNIETTTSYLEGLTLTIQGILNDLTLQNEENSINVQEVMALKKQIVDYTHNIYKFIDLILETTEGKV